MFPDDANLRILRSPARDMAHSSYSLYATRKNQGEILSRRERKEVTASSASRNAMRRGTISPRSFAHQRTPSPSQYTTSDRPRKALNAESSHAILIACSSRSREDLRPRVQDCMFDGHLQIPLYDGIDTNAEQLNAMHARRGDERLQCPTRV